MGAGDKIKSLRKSMGLTQTELGEKVGVKKNAVSKWECGRVEDIPTSTIKALATLFNVPPSYLIDDDREAPTKNSERAKKQDINILRIAGRDGSYQERALTDEQLAALKAILDQMPDVPEDL